jgi:hypothetical protein
MIAAGVLLGAVEVPGEETLPFRERVRVRVELTDGATIEGRRIELGRGVVVLDARRLPTQRIVRWDRFVGERGPALRRAAVGDLVMLVGGDRLNCKVQSIDLEHLVARWDGLARPGEFRIPLERVRAVVLGSGVPGRLRRSLASDRKGRSGDEVWLRGGDRLVGELKSLGALAVVLATEAGDRRVARKSVAASTRTDVPSASSMKIDGRQRWSRGSSDRQTAQSQPIAGTPVEVPVPRNVMRTVKSPFAGV